MRLTTESKSMNTFLEKAKEKLRFCIHISMRTFFKSDIAVIELIF